MKSIFTYLFVSFFAVSFAQNTPEHFCAKHKKQAWTNFNKANFKSISGQEKYDLNYVKLELDIDNISTEIYSAKTTLKGKVVGVSLDVFILELINNLIVDSAKINGNIVSTNRIGDELQIFPNSSIANGQFFTAEVYYHGTQPNGGSVQGIFNSVSPSWGKRVTYTLSQPFGAPSWWPCKQDLTDKIDSSEVWITVPDTLMAGSNGLLINEINLPNNKKRFEWKHNHAIDFYLISFSVADYQEYNFNVTLPNSQSVLVQNYVYDHPNLLNQFQSDIDETGAMLIEFSNKYGIYPFANEKYGHCMAPFSGGMEHQTMTTQGFFNRSLTAHELGHQWFGDHVTCATWGHIWINEGFASYSEYIFQESVNYNIAQNDMAGVHNNVMSQPGGSIYVYDDNNENAIFNSRLVYDKGSALVHMIRHWVNDDNLFFTALQTYQNIFEDSTATAEDFFSVIENIAEIDLQNELQQWYYGEGYPTFSLKYNNSPNGLIIELSQAGSMSNITPFFETAIEIKLNFNNGTDTILRVNNEWNNQQYLFNQMPTISSIEIDPLNWVLNKVGNVEEDLNLVYTSINSINKSNNITLYPNPNKGSFIVETEEQTPYKIYDLLGKEIKSGVLKEGKNQIDLLSVKGLYFFKAGKLFPVVIN